MAIKVTISMVWMVLILGIVETRVMATREMDEKYEKEVDPELTVEEVCARASNTSTCIKNFGPLANNNGKARLSYYLDEGARMARDELTKAYKFTENLTPKAQQVPNSKYIISCLEGCRHYIDLAMDRLGGHCIGDEEGGVPGAPAPAPGPGSESLWGESESGAPAPAPGAAAGSKSSLDDSNANLFFSDALTFTTTCLDELEIGETPEVFDAMDNALSQAREIIRNLLGISHVFTEPMFPIIS